MGDYRIVIEAQGGHGCERTRGDGETVYGCGRFGCPDCAVAEFVSRLAARGGVKSATLTHWPGSPGEVRDEFDLTPSELGHRLPLLPRKRHGNFPEKYPPKQT